MDFILWFQILLITPLGTVDHRQTLNHPTVFTSEAACVATAHDWIEQRLKEFGDSNYMITWECEQQPVASVPANTNHYL